MKLLTTWIPRYLPSLEEMDRLDLADVVLLLDTVEFDGRGSLHRARIRWRRGGARYLSLPVKAEAVPLYQVWLSGDGWVEEHVDLLGQAYGEAGARLGRELLHGMGGVNGLMTLVPLVTARLMDALRITGVQWRFQSLGHSVMELCQLLGCAYLAEPGEALDREAWERAGVEVWSYGYEEPDYGQPLKGLSAVDVLLTTDSPLEVIRSGRSGFVRWA